MNLDWPMNGEVITGAEYARYAEIYDVLFEGRGEDIAFYVEAAKTTLHDGAKILELGTGTGRLTQPLLEAGFELMGVDPSRDMLDKAEQRLEHHLGKIHLINAAAQTFETTDRFPLAIAPYAIMAHILTDEDRLSVYRNVFKHLERGGTFIFDDMPSWLAGVTDGSQLELYRTGYDPKSGMAVRLMTNSMDVAGDPFTVRYDFIDWLTNQNEVARRMIVRVQFRNMPLAAELELLKQAGFGAVDLLGGFDGRPFTNDDYAANTRLIFRCRKPD